MLKSRNLWFLQRRWKSGKQRWSVQQRKKTNTDRALDSFDDFYASVFGGRWKNMRAALLTEHKYIALVNNFGDTEKTCSLLEMDGAISIKSLVNLAKERFQAETATTANNIRPLEDSMERIIRRQEEREVKSVYPEGDRNLHIPERLQNRNDDGENSRSSKEMDADIEHVDARKSLEQSLREDMHLDATRIVDPEMGTGALYEYVPANKIKGMEDFVLESEHYKYYQTTADFPLTIEPDDDFTFPENLNLYTYEMGNCSDFKAPRKCLTGVLSHFLMDGASILPPLCLNIKHGERVLDACAAPGGKALLMLQTLYPDMLVCNDVQESRVNRIRKVMEEYLFDFCDLWEGNRVELTQFDARFLHEYASYDKILVDVPCTTDRHSLRENDNNLFKPSRVKERLRIPELQAGILSNCLRLLKPGGSLVYSTCSLSPIQNDGVVHMALQKAFSDFGITATVRDMSATVRLFQDIFKFENPKSLKYGQMVIPYLPANFGPMYFSKITVNK